MERNQLLAIVVIVVVVAGAGVAFVFMQQPSRPPENTLIWETIGNPDYMDPHVNYENFGGTVQYNIYETLYTYPWDSAVTDPSVPLLAASAPVVSADGLNYTIALRTGITFHDGTPFNASCVKWNFERAMKIFYPDGPVWMLAEPILGGTAVEDAAFGDGPSSPAFAAAFDNWVATSDSIIVVDDYTIKFRLEAPYSAFIAALTYNVGMQISPSFCIAEASDPAWATWEDYGVDYGEFENPLSDQTCGTGPYMLTDWVPDQFIELDLYTDYWRTSSSPNAGEIEKVFIKTNEDVNGRSLNLRTGTADVVYWPTTNALDIWSNVTEDTTDENIFVSTGGYSYTVIFFGFNMGIINMTTGTVLDEKVSPFSFLNFRRSASYAMDYTAFLSAALNGFGVQGKGCVPIGMTGHNGSTYNWEYNMTAAVEEWNLAMNETGFADSLNELDNSLTLYYNSGNTVREQGCLLLADGLTAMWADADANDTLDSPMTVTTQALEWSNYLDHIREKRMPIFFVGWAPDYADPDNYVFPFAYHRGTYAMRISYNNSEVNALYLLAKTETDIPTRNGYYSQIQEILSEDAPYLWMYQPTEFRTWRAWLHGDGLVYNPMHGYYFYHMYKAYPTA